MQTNIHKNNLENLPKDVKNYILDYAFKCKKEQNFYINKQIALYIINKVRECKKTQALSKEVCSGCYKRELKQLKLMFNYTVY